MTTSKKTTNKTKTVKKAPVNKAMQCTEERATTSLVKSVQFITGLVVGVVLMLIFQHTSVDVTTIPTDLTQ